MFGGTRLFVICLVVDATAICYCCSCVFRKAEWEQGGGEERERLRKGMGRAKGDREIERKRGRQRETGREREEEGTHREGRRKDGH